MGRVLNQESSAKRPSGCLCELLSGQNHVRSCSCGLGLLCQAGVTETRWPAHPKIFTPWPYKKKLAQAASVSPVIFILVKGTTYFPKIFLGLVLDPDVPLHSPTIAEA